jgi:sugar lactone lactonase YvrE
MWLNRKTLNRKTIVRRGFGMVPLLIALVVLAIVVAGVVAAMRIDWWGQNGNGLSSSFSYDLESFQKTDPALIGYRETARVPLEMTDPRAVAVGPEDRIYVAGDRSVAQFTADGTKGTAIKFKDEPRTLAVGGSQHAHPGRIYVAMKSRVEICDPDGTPQGAWEDLGPKALITSMALGENDIYVADAGNRIVLRYDLFGKLRGRIGARDEARNIPGLVVPSPYMDVALAPDGLLRVVNPGAHRVEDYTPEGSLELFWGEASLGVEGFCGCCNPVNIAILPDGRIVTAEKGIPRVKVYSADGKFVCVVAGPEMLLPTESAAKETRTEHRLKAVDVAADSRGRVLVLDPASHSVRVFVAKAGEKSLPSSK